MRLPGGILLAFTLFFNSVFAFNLSDYRFHTMPETSYYGGIHSIAKDSIGRIWFSGYDALFMYNGNSFIQMNDRVTGLSPSSYWAYGQVITDTSKRLYVGTNQGLLRFDYLRQEFESVLNGNVGTVTPGGDGSLWLIRDNRIESFRAEREPSLKQYPFPSGFMVTELMLVCTPEHVYVASAGKLYRLDKDSGHYDLFAELGSESIVIRDVVEYNGAVYILTHMDGLYECDGEGNITRHYNLPGEYEKSASTKKLYLDASGILWVATQSGLMLLDPVTKEKHLLRTNLNSAYSLPNNSVWSVFPDPDGGIWVGTYGGKLAYMTFFDNDVNYFKPTPGGLNHPIVSCFEEDPQGNLWIGTEGGGLNYWNRKTDSFSYYTQANRTGITSNMIKKLWYDENNILHISAFNGGMERFDERQKLFIDQCVYHPSTWQQLTVYDFLREGDSGIWLTDPDSELIYRDNRTGTTEFVPILDYAGEPVRMQVETLFRGRGGNLWLVTHNGAYVVDVETRRVLKHYYIDDAPYSVNNLVSYCIASDSGIWFGTRGGGVNRLTEDGRYINYGEQEGLLGKTVFGILEDDSSKDVWFSTNDGLYYYDYDKAEIVRSQIDDPNLCGAYYVRSCFKTKAGEMLFGGTDGFIMFTPNKIKYNNQRPRVFFTDLLVNDDKIAPEQRNSPIRKDISTLAWYEGSDNKITLTHKQSNIEICFSSDSYLQADKNQYTYRMSGLSDSWYTLPPGQKSVQFFNLPAGKYTFEIRAANNDGLWGNEISALRFEVKPSPFFSVWAYFLYSLIALYAAYFIWRYFTDKKIFVHRLEMEQVKEQNMRELTQARINFFTNISHDLKTPLTLVVDPLKQLKEQLPDDESSRAYVHLIEKNVNRIQRNISQLLQFREIESQKITLNRQPGDLVKYIDSIFSLFEFYANKKDIETDFTSQFESFYTRFDHDVIEKICTNLFSNAIKYTSENGYVGVKITKASEEETADLMRSGRLIADAEYISVTVTNTGTEIPEERKDTIFESFNRLSPHKPQFEESTGLGLAIVKELVDNIDGAVTLKSGNSMVSFTVVLPFMPNSERADTSEVSYDYTVSEIDNIIAESEDVLPAERRNRKSCDIVVIEDDANLRSYLEQRLSRHYNVYTAANGREGIAKAEKVNPQIVITDLMMPGADGFEVCRSLRSNIKTSHIPVVMLSGAGKDTENKIKALESGANVFIDKPFDMNYLLKQVANLIKNQNELKELYSKKYIAEPSKVTISSVDEELLKKAMDHIEQNIANCDYDVESFASDMAIGRTLLYQKINNITGMSIKEFILDIRLKRAAQLLKESEFTISEIAVMTGFNNPKYFSICFKRHFETTPTEFKRKT